MVGIASSSTLEGKMKISEFARQFGLTPATVRYYEALGLLERVPRVAGSRSYGSEAHASLRFVLALKRVGFTLQQIKALRALAAGERGPDGPDSWRRVARAKLAEVDRDIANLQAMRVALTQSLSCECEAATERCAWLTNEALRTPLRHSSARAR